ncbi:hypothetical protein F2P81_024192 [Scophthalmus maximus]|uniref:Uncharacterized protein n=1 Tax=Scophthalmus maximus TaxID=52904 RepID=A0A6A4RWQ8_SCOMX|nr:hypothetical protein F2P81_024192 [Scophthalmus maximus]
MLLLLLLLQGELMQMWTTASDHTYSGSRYVFFPTFICSLINPLLVLQMLAGGTLESLVSRNVVDIRPPLCTGFMWYSQRWPGSVGLPKSRYQSGCPSLESHDTGTHI